MTGFAKTVLNGTSRLTVVSRKAKEEAASSAPTDSRLTRVSIKHRVSNENRVMLPFAVSVDFHTE